MKKGIIDVELPYVPPLHHGERENDTNCGRLNHRAEGVFVVNAMTLLEPFGNETCFEALDAAVKVVLDLEHPTTVNEIDVGRCRNKTPGLIAMEGIEFSVHGSPPPWIVHGCSD
jgi:hypothetical protein